MIFLRSFVAGMLFLICSTSSEAREALQRGVSSVPADKDPIQRKYDLLLKVNFAEKFKDNVSIERAPADKPCQRENKKWIKVRVFYVKQSEPNTTLGPRSHTVQTNPECPLHTKVTYSKESEFADDFAPIASACDWKTQCIFDISKLGNLAKCHLHIYYTCETKEPGTDSEKEMTSYSPSGPTVQPGGSVKTSMEEQLNIISIIAIVFGCVLFIALIAIAILCDIFVIKRNSRCNRWIRNKFQRCERRRPQRRHQCDVPLDDVYAEVDDNKLLSENSSTSPSSTQELGQHRNFAKTPDNNGRVARVEGVFRPVRAMNEFDDYVEISDGSVVQEEQDIRTVPITSGTASTSRPPTKASDSHGNATNTECLIPTSKVDHIETQGVEYALPIKKAQKTEAGPPSKSPDLSGKTGQASNDPKYSPSMRKELPPPDESLETSARGSPPSYSAPLLPRGSKQAGRPRSPKLTEKSADSVDAQTPSAHSDLRANENARCVRSHDNNNGADIYSHLGDQPARQVVSKIYHG